MIDNGTFTWGVILITFSLIAVAGAIMVYGDRISIKHKKKK
jgi:hypothetical protein